MEGEVMSETQKSKSPNPTREQMLKRIQQNLHGVVAPELPEAESRRLPTPANADALAEQFQRMAEGVGVAFYDCLADALKGLKRVAVSDGADLPIALENVEFFEGWKSREELLVADAGLTTAQLGIAESGTLTLIGDQERHRLVSLVPPIHICLLQRKNIVGTMSEALAQLQAGEAISPLATFITGPSRTADIELQLVLGVHGPRHLRIVFL
jgi:L-lactate utilization protein LutC